MRHLLRAAATALVLVLLLPGLAAADSLAVPTPASTGIPVPARGQSMAQVEIKFGQPAQKLGAVGQPPITRWIYPNFEVYFEGRFVIHTVITRDRSQ